MIKVIPRNEKLAVAAALANDLLNDSYLFDELWQKTAKKDPQMALAILTTRNTMEVLSPGSGKGFIAGYLVQSALIQRLQNAEQVQRLFV